MSGQRHLIECHCILSIYKNKNPAIYHKFSVYSMIDKKTNKVMPKYVNCNNCGVTHLVEEIEDVFNNNLFPKGLVIKREIIDEKYNVKILNLISEKRYTIASEILNDTIVYK